MKLKQREQTSSSGWDFSLGLGSIGGFGLIILIIFIILIILILIILIIIIIFILILILKSIQLIVKILGSSSGMCSNAQACLQGVRGTDHKGEGVNCVALDIIL